MKINVNKYTYAQGGLQFPDGFVDRIDGLRKQKLSIEEENVYQQRVLIQHKVTGSNGIRCPQRFPIQCKRCNPNEKKGGGGGEDPATSPLNNLDANGGGVVSYSILHPRRNEDEEDEGGEEEEEKGNGKEGEGEGEDY